MAPRCDCPDTCRSDVSAGTALDFTPRLRSVYCLRYSGDDCLREGVFGGELLCERRVQRRFFGEGRMLYSCAVSRPTRPNLFSAAAVISCVFFTDTAEMTLTSDRTANNDGRRLAN